MKRRNFIQAATALTPLFLNGMRLNAMSRSSIFNHINNESDRVLVIIQLNGGNDGLNCVIPLDQYDHLANVRGNILIPQSNILSLTDTVGLHPKLSGFKDLYDNAKLGIIQNVGYPNQNRSHFRSKDIWMTGSPSTQHWNTGWLGRYLEDDYWDYPYGYPNNQNPDPFALTMGNIVSETCEGTSSNFSLTVNNPFNLNSLSEGVDDPLPNNNYGTELGFLRSSISQTNAYSSIISNAASMGNNMASYPNGNKLAKQLKNIALLISGGLKTKIYIASMGGFDTHSNQVNSNNHAVGGHANLLDKLATAITTFQSDLEMLGIADRVVGMTFSEFGRRIRSNQSRGTDHGTAAPLFVFGNCVNTQILGQNPEIAPDVDKKEGVPMENDFRDIYGSILMDWFNVEEPFVRNLLHQDFQYLPIMNSCNVEGRGYNFREVEQLAASTNYPNPFSDWTTISFETDDNWVRLSILDVWGHELKVLTNQHLPKGRHEIKFDGSRLEQGNYYFRLQIGQHSKAKVMVKI